MFVALGGLICGYLGFRLYDLWVPGALAVAFVAVQTTLFEVVLGGSPMFLYAFSLGLHLLVFYATFAIGRAIGLKWRKPR
jgi:hypothetical protein